MATIILLAIFQNPFYNKTEFNFSYPLGTEINLRHFPFQHDDLVEVIDQIDLYKIGMTSFSIVHETNKYNFTVTMTNDEVILDPLIGEKPFISSFGVNDTHHFVSLFNPTLTSLSLDEYGFVINDTYYGFDLGLSIPSMAEKRIELIEGVSEIGSLGKNDPLVTYFPIRHLYLRDASTYLYFDGVEITPMIDIMHQSIPTATHAFQRIPTITHPEESFTSSSWIAFTNEEQVPSHALFQPVVTPLIQAKAWSHYVMFGSGMFSAGRVEEAFRALETEYEWMDDRSQGLLFELPNTSFQGINERGRLDSSTFREAVGRYNYLAARVPGATGLINPNPSPFPVNTLILISIGLVGLFAIFALMKSRYQRV